MTIIFGKHTYHKKEIIYRSGICPHCKKESKLSNFSASQFYHLYFIPLIPKGDFHYVNYCHKCNKATTYKLDEWYSLSADTLEKAQIEYQYQKGSYNANIEMHIAYRTFAPPLEAFKFAVKMEQEFNGNGAVHQYLGQFYQDNNRLDDAIRNYKASYHTSEDKDPSCLVIGDILYRSNNYKGALKFYKQVKTFKDKSTISNLLNICSALRKEKLYSESDEILRMIQERYSENLDKIPGYKREMYHSGGRVGLDNSHYENYMIKRAVLAGSIILAILGVLVGVNFYMAQNQPLYITNGLTKKAEVTIPGNNVFYVYPDDTHKTIIAEGKHTIQIKIEEKKPYNIDINVKNNLLNRLLNKNLFVINVKGARLLEYGKILYSKRHEAKDEFDNEIKLIVGQEFITFRNIDYKFVVPPEEINLDDGKSSEVRSFVDTINPYDEIHALTILMNNLEYTRDVDILNYMRNIIAFDDPTSDFIDAYNDVVDYLEENKKGK